MLFVIFVAAKLASLLFSKFGIPGLVGEILVGIILAISIGDSSIAQFLGLYEIHDGVRSNGDNFEILHVLAELGVMFLLFSVGLETRVKDLMSVGKTAFLVALLGVIIPFILGFIYVDMVYMQGHTQYALFLGAAMVATSVGITARVIKDKHLIDAKESRIIIGAAVIDDVLGMIVLAIVSGMAGSSGDIDVGHILLITAEAFIFVIAVMVFAGKGVPKIHAAIQARNERKWKEDNNYVPVKLNMLAVAIAACFGFAWLAEFIGLAAIIGSFLAGMIFADYAFEWKLEEKIEGITTFLVSFFFVYVGLMVDISAVTTEVIISFVAVLILAIIGKYFGCGLGAKLGDKTTDKNSFNIIGIGMIPRGEVGIIVASIGLGIFGNEFLPLYTIVVLMSVATTIIAPPLLSIAFGKKYKDEFIIQPEDRL